MVRVRILIYSILANRNKNKPISSGITLINFKNTRGSSKNMDFVAF